MSPREDASTVSIVSGTVNGALSYVAGLLASAALFAVFGAKPAFRAVDAGLPRPAETFGWLFYGAHRVPVVVDGESVNYASTVAANSLVYYLLPVVTLVAAGYYVADELAPGDPGAGFVAGASTTLGYLPLVVVGSAGFAYEATDAVVTVPYVHAVVLAGLAYPIVAGGVGGVLASR